MRPDADIVHGFLVPAMLDQELRLAIHGQGTHLAHICGVGDGAFGELKIERKRFIDKQGRLNDHISIFSRFCASFSLPSVLVAAGLTRGSGEGANGGKPGGPCLQASVQPRRGDPAQREHRRGFCQEAGLTQKWQTSALDDNFAANAFLKDGTEKNQIRTSRARPRHLVQGVAAEADQALRPACAGKNRPDLRRRQSTGLGWEVHAIGPGGQGYIRPAVDQKPGSVGLGKLSESLGGGCGESEKLARVQRLFPQLHGIDAINSPASQVALQPQPTIRSGVR